MRRPVRPCAFLPAAIVATFASCPLARADDAVERAPIPEPIFGETVTDIDGIEKGELEVSGDAGELGSRRGGAMLRLASIEAEWLATERLGLRLEPSLVGSRGPGLAPRTDPGLGAAVSWKLVHDLADDFYLQAEAGGDWTQRADLYASPHEPGEPFVVGLHAAYRRGLWTLRGGAGAGAGAASPHVPLRGTLALLVSLDRSSSTGFVGLEAVADGSWVTPVFVAPNVVADLSPIGLPARLGLALPWSPGAGATQPSLGVYLRLIVEPLRDLQR